MMIPVSGENAVMRPMTELSAAIACEKGGSTGVFEMVAEKIAKNPGMKIPDHPAIWIGTSCRIGDLHFSHLS
jgi:hypothetical protein